MIPRPLLALALLSLLAACPRQRTDLDPNDPNRLEDATDLPDPETEHAKVGPPPAAQGNVVVRNPNHAGNPNAPKPPAHP